MVLGHLVNFPHNIFTLLPSMGQKELERKRWLTFADPFANDSQEKFYPSHQTVKESFALGMNFMNKGVECLLVSGYEIDKQLNGTLGILLCSW
jgi:hypothetical protein